MIFKIIYFILLFLFCPHMGSIGYHNDEGRNRIRKYFNIYRINIFNNIDYPLNLSISLKGGKETN